MVLQGRFVDFCRSGRRFRQTRIHISALSFRRLRPAIHRGKRVLSRFLKICRRRFAFIPGLDQRCRVSCRFGRFRNNQCDGLAAVMDHSVLHRQKLLPGCAVRTALSRLAN